MDTGPCATFHANMFLYLDELTDWLVGLPYLSLSAIEALTVRRPSPSIPPLKESLAYPAS